MKTFFTILIFNSLFTLTVFCQDETKYFAQGLFQIEEESTIKTIENNIRNNASVVVARLDIPTKRFFILTNQAINEQTLSNWFGVYGNTIKCVQQGTYGVDTIYQYPFIGCNE